MSKVEANSQQRVQMEWLDLRALTDYVAVSERTAREWIHRAEDPLPSLHLPPPDDFLSNKARNMQCTAGTFSE